MKGNFSKRLIIAVIILNVLFTAAVLVVFWHTGSEPSSLVVAWFAFTSSELIAVAAIKTRKIKSDSLLGKRKESEEQEK